MPRAIAIDELTSRIEAVIDSVASQGDAMIIATDGEPRAVIISYAEYRRFEAGRAREQHDEAAETLRRLRDRVSGANPDLSDDERMGLADRAVRDAVAGLVARGAFRSDG